jgi:hypothetical protein
MLILLTSLLIGFLGPNAAEPSIVCEIGRVALRDLPPVVLTPMDYTYHIDAGSGHHGLLAVCPSLRAELPAGYSIADETAWARANVHVPIPGKRTSPAIIYLLGVPKVAPDAQSAILEWGYTCTGLCGGGSVSHYVRTATGWRLDGGPRAKWVS